MVHLLALGNNPLRHHPLADCERTRAPGESEWEAALLPPPTADSFRQRPAKAKAGKSSPKYATTQSPTTWTTFCMSAELVLLGAGEPERPRGDAFFGELRPTGVSSSLESSSSCDSVFGRSGSYLAGFLGVLPLRRDIVELPELAEAGCLA